MEGFIPASRDGHSAVVYENWMIVFGGFEEDNQRFSQETFAYDFITRKWTELIVHGESFRMISVVCFSMLLMNGVRVYF